MRPNEILGGLKGYWVKRDRIPQAAMGEMAEWVNAQA